MREDSFSTDCIIPSIADNELSDKEATHQAHNLTKLF